MQNSNGKAKKTKAQKKADRAVAEAQAIRRITGQGGYYTDKILPALQKAFPPGTFASAGGFVGDNIGSKVIPGVGGGLGRKAGSYLGTKLAQIVGFGDYQVKSNSLTTTGAAIPEGMEVPTFSTNGHETVVVHREYIGDVVVPSSTPTDFHLTSYRINAGNATLFPWLAAVAARYQQFRFRGLVFEFKTLSSDITAGGALGSVIMGTNYDAIARNFPSKILMENAEYSTSAKPSRSQIHAIECDPTLTSSKLLYVRDDSRGLGTTDDRFYDLGIFQIATQGLPGSAGAVLGELWASYDVALYKPDLSALDAGVFSYISTSGSAIGSPFGTTGTRRGSPIISDITPDTIKFTHSGTYLMTLRMSINTLSGISFSGPVAVSQFDIAAGAANFVGYYKVTCNAPGDTMTLNVTGVSMSLTAFDLVDTDISVLV